MSAILGFALQATLGNLFSGVALQLEQPFNLGDRIALTDAISGVVIHMTWRSVQIKTSKNEIITIPNAQIAGQQVTIFAAEDGIITSLEFSASIKAAPAKVIQIIRDVLNTAPNVDRNKEVLVTLHFVDRTTGSNNYQISYYPENFSARIHTNSIILQWVWYAFCRNNIAHWDEEETVTHVNTLPLLKKQPLFKALAFSDEVYQGLSKQVKTVLYAPNEPIKPKSDALYMVSEGIVFHKMLQPPSDWKRALLQRRQFVKTDAGGIFCDNATLEDITTQLINYLGPIAKHLIATAQRKTSDLYYFYHLLAEEIFDKNARMAFLQHAPETPSMILYSGDYFGAFQLLTDSVNLNVTIHAQTETRLIEIPKAVLFELLKNTNGYEKIFYDDFYRSKENYIYRSWTNIHHTIKSQ